MGFRVQTGAPGRIYTMAPETLILIGCVLFLLGYWEGWQDARQRFTPVDDGEDE